LRASEKIFQAKFTPAGQWLAASKTNGFENKKV